MILLVGGGVASASAASELRAQGYSGRILLVGRELDRPYERPPVSKGHLLAETEPTFLELPDDVEVLTRTSVMKLDPSARTATLSNKDVVSFDKALIATGANVRRLPLEGSDLDGIHYLRSPRNSAALRADVSEGSRLGIVGGSFVACEVAASLASRGIRSTLVFPEEGPLATHFGRTVGDVVLGVLESHGITVCAGENSTHLRGEGRASAIVCESGLEVSCDAVLIAVGAQPDVMLARSAGLELGERGGVRCSSQLETSVAGVFAAGDMCEYSSVLHGRSLRIEHFEVAAAQGRCAARNMLGAGEDFREVPYFWTDLADWLTLESVGPADEGWDDEEVRGDPASLEFSVMYRRAGALVAAVTAGRPADLDEARAALS